MEIGFNVTAAQSLCAIPLTFLLKVSTELILENPVYKTEFSR